MLRYTHGWGWVLCFAHGWMAREGMDFYYHLYWLLGGRARVVGRRISHGGSGMDRY